MAAGPYTGARHPKSAIPNKHNYKDFVDELLVLDADQKGGVLFRPQKGAGQPMRSLEAGLRQSQVFINKTEVPTPQTLKVREIPYPASMGTLEKPEKDRLKTHAQNKVATNDPLRAMTKETLLTYTAVLEQSLTTRTSHLRRLLTDLHYYRSNLMKYARNKRDLTKAMSKAGVDEQPEAWKKRKVTKKAYKTWADKLKESAAEEMQEYLTVEIDGYFPEYGPQPFSDGCSRPHLGHTTPMLLGSDEEYYCPDCKAINFL